MVPTYEYCSLKLVTFTWLTLYNVDERSLQFFCLPDWWLKLVTYPEALDTCNFDVKSAWFSTNLLLRASHAAHHFQNIKMNPFALKSAELCTSVLSSKSQFASSFSCSFCLRDEWMKLESILTKWCSLFLQEIKRPSLVHDFPIRLLFYYSYAYFYSSQVQKYRVNEERNILSTIKRKRANWKLP